MSIQCYHRLPRAARQSYKFTSPVYKTPIVGAPSMERSRTFVLSRLAREMAHGGHIYHENYEFIGVKGPAPASAFSRSPDLHSIDLDPMAHSGHTLGTPLGGCIPEFTYPEGLVSSLINGRGQVSRPGNQRSTARNKLTRGMASSGHIPLGNHVVDHLRGPASTSTFSCGPGLCPGGLVL